MPEFRSGVHEGLTFRVPKLEPYLGQSRHILVSYIEEAAHEKRVGAQQLVRTMLRYKISPESFVDGLNLTIESDQRLVGFTPSFAVTASLPQVSAVVLQHALAGMQASHEAPSSALFRMTRWRNGHRQRHQRIFRLLRFRGKAVVWSVRR
ncbi:hypothetical protein D621_00265 [beta proteobacterium AAP51]|nr:hypothetical protein D621_00265 [beta proteobacterium AAP51]